MFTKYGLPLIAIAGAVFAGYMAYVSAQTQPPSKAIVEPANSPWAGRMITGAGLVEARRENIPIGVSVPGVVTDLYVKKGDRVKKGDSLFRVDDRDLNAQLKVNEAMLASSRAQLHKLKAAPRPEDVPPAEASVEEAKARMNDTEAAMARTERLYNRQMAPAGDYDKDRYAFYAAKAALSKAIAELERIKRGTWKEDIDVAQAAVDLAQSQVDSIKINLERLTVRSPSEGEILQLNVRLGQFAALIWKEPLMVLGDVETLHVRVDIDENEVPLFDENGEAVAFLKGKSIGRFSLKKEYVEPYMIPKQSLTGANSDRVDTRVLQVVYRLPDRKDRPFDVHVGQQMDVFIKANAASSEIDSMGTPADPFGIGAESEVKASEGGLKMGGAGIQRR